MNGWSARFGGQQVVQADGGSPDAADDDAGGPAGQACRLLQAGSAGQGQGQRGRHRIACPGDVEDLAGLGGNVDWRLAFLEQGHACGTPGDQHPGHAQQSEQTLACLDDVLGRRDLALEE